MSEWGGKKINEREHALNEPWILYKIKLWNLSEVLKDKIQEMQPYSFNALLVEKEYRWPWNFMRKEKKIVFIIADVVREILIQLMATISVFRKLSNRFFFRNGSCQKVLKMFPLKRNFRLNNSSKVGNHYIHHR